jgi:hypothetical protein
VSELEECDFTSPCCPVIGFAAQQFQETRSKYHILTDTWTCSCSTSYVHRSVDVGSTWVSTLSVVGETGTVKKCRRKTRKESRKWEKEEGERQEIWKPAILQHPQGLLWVLRPGSEAVLPAVLGVYYIYNTNLYCCLFSLYSWSVIINSNRVI